MKVDQCIDTKGSDTGIPDNVFKNVGTIGGTPGKALLPGETVDKPIEAAGGQVGFPLAEGRDAQAA